MNTINMKETRIIRDKIRHIFENSQESVRHQSLLEKCKALYKEHTDVNVFLDEFIGALRYCICHPDKEAVENILNFTAKFVIHLYAIEANQDDLDSSNTISEDYTFPSGILEFIFETHCASLSQIRLRCLQLLNKILSGMPQDCTISDGIWVKLKETVLTRVQDKSSTVRVQAVITSRKLQNPKDPDCEVIRTLVFHLNDPCSAVRRAVVSSIALNKFTIGHVLARTRDVNDNVRRNTYIIFSKVRVMNLTIKYRLTILERGLQDRSAMVRNCVQSVLLVNWLENFNRDIIKFLEALDVINCPDVVINIVENLFKVQCIDEILKSLPLDEETRTIPAEKLTPEIALLWRVVAHHLWKEKNDEELEKILPNITSFCEYIKSFYPLHKKISLDMSNEEKWEGVKENEILRHLLELIKVFDLSDELGRTHLKKLIFSMLTSERINNDFTECLIELVASVIPSQEMFLHEVTEVISELREPLTVENGHHLPHKQLELDLKMSDLKMILNDLREKEYNCVSNKDYVAAQSLKYEIEETERKIKNFSVGAYTSQEVREEKNDPVTVCKCLTILFHMIRFSKVRTLTPTLINIKDNFLNQCLTSQDFLTQSLSLQVLGQFCLLDLDLAKENLFRFILMLSESGEDEINGPALKSVFDILLYHGIKPFVKLHSCDEQENKSVAENVAVSAGGNDLFSGANEESDMLHCTKFIPIIIELLNCKSNDVLKSTAYEGLCKLLLSGTIYSATVLQKIIIKGFSPIVDNECEDYIRQIFVVFFPAFASTTPRSQEMIELAFIPTLRCLMEAPLGTPEGDINAKDVASFLIEYTHPDINKHTCMTRHVHNNLAMSICNEILKEVDECADTEVLSLYLRSLNQLKISPASEAFAHQMLVLTNKMKKELNDRIHLKLVNEFRKKIENVLQNTLTSIENTLKTENTRCSHEDALNESECMDERGKDVLISETIVPERSDRSAIEVADESSDSTIFVRSTELVNNKKNFIPESPDVSE